MRDYDPAVGEDDLGHHGGVVMNAQDWSTLYDWISYGASVLFSKGGLWAVGSTMAVLLLTKLFYGWR